MKSILLTTILQIAIAIGCWAQSDTTQIADTTSKLEKKDSVTRKMPTKLLNAVKKSKTIFEQHLCNNGVKGVIYVYLGEHEGEIVVPEECGIFAAFIPKYNTNGSVDFIYIDKIDSQKGEKMGFANGHIVVIKHEGAYSYEIDENKLKSVTSIIATSDDQLIVQQGSSKEDLKNCTGDDAEPHFDFHTIDIEEYQEKYEEYPWK